MGPRPWLEILFDSSSPEEMLQQILSELRDFREEAKGRDNSIETAQLARLRE